MQNLQHNNNTNCREGVWKLLCYGFKDDNLKWNIISTDKKEDMFLILKNMSLMILKGNKLEESFSLIMHDIKRIVYDKDSMAFVVEQQGVKRRLFRLRFAGGVFYTGEYICNQCVQTLGHYIIPDCVNKDDQTDKPNISLMQYVSEFVKNSKGLSPQKLTELESVYPLEDIVDECILDVNFPDIVVKVRELLDAKLGSTAPTK